MRLQRTLVALSVCGLIAPVAFAQRGASGGHASGQSVGGHASGSAPPGRANGGHATRGSRGQMPGARNGSRVATRTPGVPPRFIRPTPSNPAGLNLPLPNPTVFGSAALPMAPPRSDIFRARPNTYGQPFRRSPAIGAYAGGPFFYGDGEAPPSTMAEADSAPSAPAAVAAPATIIAAGPPASDDPHDVDDLHRHGEIRFDVQPLTAQVFVDGAPGGTVADYYHALVGLSLPAGAHRLELRAAGFETMKAEVDVKAGRTVTYRAIMKR